MRRVGPLADPPASQAAARRGAALGHLAMLGFAALVAGSFSLGALAAPHIEPTALTALRFLIAGVVMGALAAAGPGVRRAHWAAPWRFALLGGLFATYFVLMFEALRITPPVSTSVVFTLTPVMAAGFAWLWLRQRLTARTAAALAIGAAGAVWVIFRGELAALIAFQPGRGEAIFLVGCVAHAAFTPLVARLNRGEPALVSTAFVMLGGFVVVAAVAAGEIATTDWTALPAIVWITAAYLGVATTAVTFLLMQFAALRLPSARVMAYTYLVPVFVILWELARGAAPPPMAVMPGIALTLVALLLLLKQDGPAPVRAAG
jgi:drug/metabolite transporter (DMT)-like permease